MLVAVSGGDPVKYADTGRMCTHVDFIGGFSALVGYASGDKELIEAIPEALVKHSTFVPVSMSGRQRPASIWMP